jgi:hypothetical protein
VPWAGCGSMGRPATGRVLMTASDMMASWRFPRVLCNAGEDESMPIAEG